MSKKLAIELNNVNKIYPNGTIALENMSLSINEGEFISLVGPSGCGKSTVLRIIAGLSGMNTGSITWGDRHLQKQLAFVFQEAALMPWANVIDNVKLPLKLAKISAQEAQIACEETLKLVGLKGFELAYPRELSGGMKMRVSIARSLITKPQVLLMDEPFGALDEITRSKLNGDLLKLWYNQRWTVVFVTHNIYEAVYMSNRVIVMAARPGKVVADIKINSPYPRTEDFRTDEIYIKYCREVSHCLFAAMAETENQ